MLVHILVKVVTFCSSYLGKFYLVACKSSSVIFLFACFKEWFTSFLNEYS